MGKIYINQDVLKIELTYNELPGEIAASWIMYRNPEGITAKIPTEAVLDEAGSKVYYIFSQGETLGDYGRVGRWKFWISFDLTDGRTIPGEPVTWDIFAQGT